MNKITKKAECPFPEEIKSLAEKEYDWSLVNRDWGT